MTREEAINELKTMSINYPLTNGEDRASRLMQARDIAVEALEHPERNVVAIVPCGDVISRQAVLDLVDSYSESRSNVEDVTQDFISDIVALPPVTSQPRTGRWMHGKINNECWEECSECHVECAYPTLYCPNCGCRMIEPQESEEI